MMEPSHKQEGEMAAQLYTLRVLTQKETDALLAVAS
jgi:hypothetical protein